MIQIGSQKIATKVFLAPMSGVSDLPFRLIAREHGARFCFYEMLDANSFFYGSRRTFAMMKTLEKDAPIAAQIVGAEPEIMLRAADRVLESVKISFLDINAACPVKKVLKKKSGAYLLSRGDTLCAIIKRLAASVPVPITVKIRLAFHHETPQDIVRLAKRCEDSGAAAIFVHGRTRLQGYHGDIDYTSIASIKKAVSIPVIGSGNVFTPESAARMLDSTGCDAVLVARGAFGNPWIFEDIETYLKTGKTPAMRSVRVRKEVLRRHITYIEELNGSRGKAGVMRKVALWYLKSFPSARKKRGEISVVNSYEKMLRFIEDIDAKEPEDEHTSSGQCYRRKQP